MGNYLTELRVPPPSSEEDERNSPFYYDWTVPKWTPFREPPSGEPQSTQQQKASTAHVASRSNETQTLTTQRQVDSASAPGDKQKSNSGGKEPQPTAPKSPRATKSNQPVAHNSSVGGRDATRGKQAAAGSKSNPVGAAAPLKATGSVKQPTADTREAASQSMKQASNIHKPATTKGN